MGERRLLGKGVNETGVEEVGREEGMESEAGEIATEVEIEDVREEEQVDFVLMRLRSCQRSRQRY